jgi:hypothetical protein
VKIINDLGYSELNFEWVKQNNEDSFREKLGPLHYTVTELLEPIRSIILFRRYYKCMKRNISEMQSLMVGDALHEQRAKTKVSGYLLETGSKKRTIPRLSMTAGLDGMELSGGIDAVKLDSAKLDDLKTTTTWNLTNKREETVTKWILQLSMYRMLMMHNKDVLLPLGISKEALDYPSLEAIITVYVKDFMSWKSKDITSQIFEMTVDLWDEKAIHNFVKNKMNMIRVYLGADDDSLPICTDEERWIDLKSGIYKKCEKYCGSRTVCKFGK